MQCVVCLLPLVPPPLFIWPDIRSKDNFPRRQETNIDSCEPFEQAMSLVRISKTSNNRKQHHLPDLFGPNTTNIQQLSNKDNSTAKTQLLDSTWLEHQNRRTPNTELLGFLPQVPIPNSALVHQRASAAGLSSGTVPTVGDHLAAASVQAGASLPLMIGNRPKCVVNLVEQQQSQPSHQHQNNPPSASQLAPVGPQNTALRAEQRRQNMSVSVVRPVVAVSGAQADNLSEKSKSSSSNSLIDDWISFDRKYLNSGDLVKGQTSIDELLFSIKAANQRHYEFHAADQATATNARQLRFEQEHLQQERQHVLAMAHREQHELNRGLRRQHQFVVDKLEERKRQLSIVQSVWVQRDFKHAIEMLVDIYHQGLIFTSDNQQPCKLKSLNTSLVVDVISIVILRPKLWTLEICQLLLPIINQDLLVQTNQYEYYTEIGLKALKLILTHFSFIITSTLSSLKDSNKVIGVDLSREDRINKCIACYKLLLESHSVMSQQQHKHHSNNNRTQLNSVDNQGKQCKLAAFQRELQTMFNSLFSSVELDPGTLARRFCG